MTAAANKDRYFLLLNLFVIIIISGITIKTFISGSADSEYRFRLNETAHYIKTGFTPGDGITGSIEVPPGQNVRADLLEETGRMFLTPGDLPGVEFTITAVFDYTSQYDALMAGAGVIPGIKLPGLGNSYEIYLNGHLVVSEWHVGDGGINVHKLARGAVYPIDPSFFIRSENTLTYRVYGDPSTVDTGLAVTEKYLIDDIDMLGMFDFYQVSFAGICLAVALVFVVFFLLYSEKKLNLWFSATALSISIYTFFRANAFVKIFPDYRLALRLEVISLFAFAFFMTVLIYTCGKEKFNAGMKIYTGLYAVFTAAVFLPGQQFVIDVTKMFFILFAPFIVYAFVVSLCIPIAAGLKGAVTGGQSAPRYIFRSLSGTLGGNMLIGAFLPIVFAMFDQVSYVVFSYHEIVLSQYGFLFFIANITFALASDNAETHDKLMVLSDELRALISERETELVRKRGEVEEVKSEQIKFRETVSREILAPLGEIIGSIELKMLHAGLSEDSANWLRGLLESERGIRRKLDDFIGGGDGHTDTFDSGYNPVNHGAVYDKNTVQSGAGGTRHLFVINPKSFVTLEDLKNFLLSIEKCFSVGHRAEYKVYISRYPRDAYSAVHRYLSATPPGETARVYAVGGDGILFDCLNGLAQFPNAELAPIPYGNANDFVRSYGAENIPLFRDIKLMSKAPSRHVDVIHCGQQYALCGCSIGIEARAVQVFSNAIERINTGKARYFVPLLYKLGAVKSLIDGSQNNMKYRVSFDGENLSGDYLFISVGNVALNGGSNIPNPLALPDDGYLDVITCESSSVPQAMRMIPAYTAGQYRKFPKYFNHYRVKEIHCESDKLMSVILDGETFYTRGIDMKILPGAVRIVSPGGINFADFSPAARGGVI